MSETAWDYSALAETYSDRPGYADEVINSLIKIAGLENGARVADMGAGTGHLTIPLLQAGLRVDAVEPNRQMRERGIARTARYDSVAWTDATAEESELEERAYALVSFGSSFNVTHRPSALLEASRLLTTSGWFVCMWNHRDLSDGLQQQVEELIREEVPNYGYGTRREDQTAIIDSSGLFAPVVKVEGATVFETSREEWIKAWSSHATLSRQAGRRFDRVVARIGDLVRSEAGPTMAIPYHTRAWIAKVRA
jgi:ubiquinone/menaquinone biosynthesis C-methylase UbiE